MHKNLCATFCGKPVETVETVEKANKGSPTNETGKLRHALRTAHRAYRMTFGLRAWNHAKEHEGIYSLYKVEIYITERA